MRNRIACFAAVALLCLGIALDVRAQISVSGNLKDLGVNNATGAGTYVLFTLRNYGSNIPKVSGTNVIVSPISPPFKPDASGVISGTIQPTDTISPNGTYYQVCIYYQGQAQWCQNYVINSTPNPWNLNSASPMTTTPIAPAQVLGARTFVFTQGTAATTWTVLHNFNDRNVLVECFSLAGVLLTPSTLTVTDPNTVTVTFGSGQTGTCVVQDASQQTLTTAVSSAVVTNPTANQVITGYSLSVPAGLVPGVSGTPTTGDCVKWASGTSIADTVGTCATQNQANTFTGTNTFSGSLTASGNGAAGNVPIKPAASDAIRYVSANGSDTNDGLSWGTAKATLAGAIAALTGGVGTVHISGAIISQAAGVTLNRNVRIICEAGGGLKLTSATGTLLSWSGTGSSGWLPAGVTGCILQGNGGGSDTSVGVSLGNSTTHAQMQGIVFEHDEILNFGTGVLTVDGAAFGWKINNSTVHNNACNGIEFSSSAAPENPSINHSVIFNNGSASATCSGIVVDASSSGEVRISNSSIDNNGNGTLGQIYSPGTGSLGLYLSNVHMEDAAGADRNEIELLSQGGPSSTVIIVGGNIVKNPGTLPASPAALIKFAAGSLNISSAVLVSSGGSLGSTPFIDFGASVGGQGQTLITRNVEFQCGSSGTPANCEAVTTSGGPTFGNFDMTGTRFSGFGTSTRIANFANGIVGCADFAFFGPLANFGGPTGSRYCTYGFGIIQNQNLGTIQAATLTANRTFTLPDATGTFGLVLSGSVAGSTTALAANSCGDAVTATITGATTSMGVVVTPSADPGTGLQWKGWVSTAGTVTIDYCNVTTAGITPAAATFNIRVIQ